MNARPARMPGWLWPVLTFMVFLGAWYGLIALLAPARRFMLPAPHAVAYSFIEYKETLLSATLTTLQGAAVGFGAAVAGSIGLALLLSLSPLIRRCLHPFLLALQTTPIIVIAPILILWVGAGLTSVAIITFLVSFFPLVVNTTQGLLATDPHQVELFRLYRATRWQELFLLRVPAALPYFFTGLRIAATLAPIGAIVGDYNAGNAAQGEGGLGFLTLIFSAQFKMPALFATALTSCGLGFVFNQAAAGLARLTLQRWERPAAVRRRTAG